MTICVLVFDFSSVFLIIRGEPKLCVCVCREENKNEYRLGMALSAVMLSTDYIYLLSHTYAQELLHLHKCMIKITMDM